VHTHYVKYSNVKLGNAPKLKN